MTGCAPPGFARSLLQAGAALVLTLPVAACGRASGSGSAASGPETTTLGLEELVDVVQPKAPEQPLVVNFWATWCAPCVAELPELAEVAAEYAGSVRVIAVSLDLALPYSAGIRSPRDVAAFLEERNLALELIVFDGTAEELTGRLDLPGPIPFTYALDRAGRRVDTIESRADRARFRTLFEAARH